MGESESESESRGKSQSKVLGANLATLISVQAARARQFHRFGWATKMAERAFRAGKLNAHMRR